MQNMPLQHLNIDFLIHFFVQITSVYILFTFIHFPKFRHRASAFGFFMISIIVFSTTFFLKDINVSLGFTFGLFAVFSNLRYRTEPISTEKMTYLFVAIGLAMINAVAPLSYFELALINPLLLLITYVVQNMLFSANEGTKKIKYEKIDLIDPERYDDLLVDLRLRTGLDITRVDIGNIDFVRDTANLKIYYSQTGHQFEDYQWGDE